MENLISWLRRLTIRWLIVAAFVASVAEQAYAEDLQRGARLFKACVNCHVVDNAGRCARPETKA